MRWVFSTLVAAFIFIFCLSVIGLSAADPVGKLVYEKNCKMCHGSDGRGDSQVATVFKLDLARLDLTDKETTAKKDSELIKTATKGVGDMKGFQSRLKSKEIREAIKYIRSLKQ